MTQSEPLLPSPTRRPVPNSCTSKTVRVTQEEARRTERTSAAQARPCDAAAGTSISTPYDAVLREGIAISYRAIQKDDRRDSMWLMRLTSPLSPAGYHI